MEEMNSFVEEVIAEAIGASKKKWALLVAALLVGSIGTLWLVARARKTGSPRPEAEPVH